MNLDELWALARDLDGRAVPGVRMTETEFADWCPEKLRAEWADGEVVLMAPANVEHDALEVWLTRLIGDFVEEHDLGALHTDIFVRFPKRRRRRVPDLLFVARDRLSLLKDTHLDGPPDLLVEIVSPDSQSRDRRTKYLEYEAAGVREYWIVDPLSHRVEIYALRGKTFARVPADGQGRVRSSVLAGLFLKPEWLWQRPLPKVSAVLRQVARKR